MPDQSINQAAINAVDNILNAQASSLDARVQNVNNTVTSQQRIVALNDSYSKRVAAYTKMVLLTVFVLTITVLLKILQSKLPFITDGIMTVVYIVAFSVCIIYAWLVNADINSREKTDFDKLNLAPPKGLTNLSADQQAQIAASAVSAGDLSGLLPGMCIGADCCKDIEGVAWDNDAQQCMIKTV